MGLKFAIAESINAEYIKDVRKKLKLTQKELAGLLNCSKSTVERWELSTEPIKGPIVLALGLLEKNPGLMESIRIPEKTLPVRMIYMHKQSVCTIIDVDELRKEVKIKNYTEHVMFKAFGNVEEPDYDMYLEFLESRCFPKSRDKLKLVLEDLGVPFYDPFMIIEKTEGRMAEDDFWIKIER